MSRKITTAELCQIGIFAAFICVIAQITIPMPYGVPITMQTLAIPIAGVILGEKKGPFSVLVYVFLGAIGLPVFAGFTGGVGVIAGPTGGFILSFPIMALTAGIGSYKDGRLTLFLCLVLGSIINYVVGMVFFSFATNSSLSTAFVACVLPFIPTAIIKIVLAGVLGSKLKYILEKNGLI